MTASLFPPARFGHLPRWAALSILAVFGLVVAIGLIFGAASPKTFRAQPHGLGGGDFALYARIVQDVRCGEPYRHAAVREQRRWGYPTHPALTVREPTLAVALSWLPSVSVRRGGLIALTLGVFAAWGWRVQRLYEKPVFTVGVLASLSFGVFFVGTDKAYLFHECWSGLLVALSLALYRPSRWEGSVLVGLIAALVRELALPYLLVMAGAALFERRKTEALAWALAITVFAGIFLWHVHQVDVLVLPGDLGSRGWLGFGGWPNVLLLAKWNALLIASSDWVAAFVVPLMVLGAVGWPGALGLRLAVSILGYSAFFSVFGRADTSYWGLMTMPMMAISLAAAPSGLWALGGRFRKSLECISEKWRPVFRKNARQTKA